MATGCTVSLCMGHMVVRPGPLKDCYISQLTPPLRSASKKCERWFCRPCQRILVNMNPQIIKEIGGDKTRQWKLQWVYCFHAFIGPKSSGSSTIASGR